MSKHAKPSEEQVRRFLVDLTLLAVVVYALGFIITLIRGVS
ncbi:MULTISPECIES: hypothetical protein [Arthrobacter]|nr:MULTISPECIES: hypothetical protein [Arthrobacter]